jgi:hypothetical protein
MTTRANIKCLGCGIENDSHAEATDGEAEPQDGNLSICLYCGYLSAYTHTEDGVLTVREMTDIEREIVEDDPGIQRLLAAREEVMGRARRAEAP